MAEHADGKLIPPPDILKAELNERIEQKIHDTVVERVLREANVEAQVAAALAEIDPPDTTALTDGIKQLFEERPDAEWRDHIEAIATELTDAADDADGGEEERR
jgi:hypothetical protein